MEFNPLTFPLFNYILQEYVYGSFLNRVPIFIFFLYYNKNILN